MAVGDGHGNGPQPRPPMNQLGHVVLRVRYRPENLIDGIQDARHQPHVRCQAAPTQILRQARVVLFRFWVDRGAALLESATGEMTYLLLCKPRGANPTTCCLTEIGGGSLQHVGSGIACAPEKWCERRRFFRGRGTQSRNKPKKAKRRAMSKCE